MLCTCPPLRAPVPFLAAISSAAGAGAAGAWRLIAGRRGQARSQPVQHTWTWHPWQVVTKCRGGKIDPAVPPNDGRPGASDLLHGRGLGGPAALVGRWLQKIEMRVGIAPVSLGNGNAGRRFLTVDLRCYSKVPARSLLPR